MNKLLFLVLMSTATLAAQDVQLEAVTSGQTFRIRASCVDGVALSILSRLADQIGALVEFSGPEINHRLTQEILTLACHDMPIEEFLLCIGNALNLDIRWTGKTLRIHPPPESSAPDFNDYCRDQALKFVLRENSAELTREEEADVLLARGELQAAAGHLEDAILTYDEFLIRFPEHPRSAEACLAAQRLALQAGRPGDVVRLFELHAGRFPNHPDTAKTEILLARAFMLEDRMSEANLVLERLSRLAARREVPARDGIVAELLLAEHYFRLGHPEQSLDVLSRIEFRDERLHPDLSLQLPLYSGICRGRLKQMDEAVYDLVVAAHLAPRPGLKARSMVELGAVYLENGNAFEALAAVRSARTLGVDEVDEVRLLHFEGEALARLALHDRAVESFTQALVAARSPRLTAAQRRKYVGLVMNRLGEVLFEQRHFEVARRVFSGLQSHKDIALRATYMLARCEFETGHFESSLAILQQLPTRIDDSALALDVKKLLGDCWVQLGQLEHAIRIWNEEEAAK